MDGQKNAWAHTNITINSVIMEAVTQVVANREVSEEIDTNKSASDQPLPIYFL